MQPSAQLLEQHYSDLKGKPFFAGLVSYMASGPVVPMVFEGLNAVAMGRKMLGATKPADSEPGTIRGDFCLDVGRNLCHGSDAVEAAKAEIALWFGAGELVSWADHSAAQIYETPPSGSAPAAPAPAAGGKGKGKGGGEKEAAAAVKEEKKADKPADKAPDAAKEAKEREKALAKSIKEGGKKGVELEGASDMGGLDFFCTSVDCPDGDMELLEEVRADGRKRWCTGARARTRVVGCHRSLRLACAHACVSEGEREKGSERLRRSARRPRRQAGRQAGRQR
jgi:nucleoside-diphosphate kinase